MIAVVEIATSHLPWAPGRRREVHRLALRARRAVQQAFMERPPLDRDLDPSTMRNLCVVASQVVMRLLRTHGYQPFRVEGYFFTNHTYRMVPDLHPHTWVEVDGWIVDVTATQFLARAPRVWIVSPAENTRWSGWSRQSEISRKLSGKPVKGAQWYRRRILELIEKPVFPSDGFPP